MGATKPRQSKREHQEQLLDEALEETFPASDPPALVGPGGGISGPEDDAPLEESRGEVSRREQPGSKTRRE